MNFCKFCKNSYKKSLSIGHGNVKGAKRNITNNYEQSISYDRKNYIFRNNSP